MSEQIVLPPNEGPAESLKNPAEEEVKSENAATPKAVVEEPDDDLEDGEIDDDDDNDVPFATIDSKIVGAVPPPPMNLAGMGAIAAPAHPVMDIMNEPPKKPKSKKHHVVEEDFAGSIESAIAAALKKDGILPPKPKILESREEEKHSDKEVQSKSSRRRKRKKLRDDREKEKEKKKPRPSPDTTHLQQQQQNQQPPIDEDVDDDEMLCVRGGSPPPAGFLSVRSMLETDGPSKKDQYDSDDSYSSYDSYDSSQNYMRYSGRKKEGNNAGSSGSRSKRKERNSRREEERRSEKRNRRNYDDSGGEDKYQDRHPQQPRKLELCKFYLMECCAKKDKCSYMHSDFPCKYYYLGMECVYRGACKFSHGKPLTDQLRCVLLKHLETAPKEILGTFRRISRENALNLMNAAHERICEEHGVENTLASATMTTQSIVQTQASGVRNGDANLQQLQIQMQQLQPEIIPSLLDMVINIPPNGEGSAAAAAAAGGAATSGGQLVKAEKQRKSRWCENTTNPVALNLGGLEPPSSNAPSYLDLRNLTGILSAERIEALSQLGVVNLEQVNQLTLSQLNKIGLTVAEISEIQLNARNMARIEAVNEANGIAAANAVASTFCLPLTTTTMTTSTVTSDKTLSTIKPETGMTTTAGAGLQDSHTPSNAGGIDYSQYLRDSNLGYDKSDLLDDEKDEEQLVIDYQDLDALDDNSQLIEPIVKEESDYDSKGSNSYSYGGDSNDSRLPPPIQLSDKLQNLLKDPANLYTVNVSALLNQNEGLQRDSAAPSSSNYEENGYYGAATSRSSRRDKDSRDEYRDPRLEEYYPRSIDGREEYQPRPLDPNYEEYHPRPLDPREEYRPRPLDPRDEYRDPRLAYKPSKKRSSPLSYRPNSTNSDDDSDRSRSVSPATTLAQQMENFVPLYERQSMYDWTPKCIQEDLEYSRSTKADKDMRLSRFLDSTNSDIDLRLPFQPVTNMQIAKEIDGSMSTLRPIPYKIVEIDVPEPKYSDLRQSFQCDDSTDPRLRRILGQRELSNSKVLAALNRPKRPSIASPSSAESTSPTRDNKDKPPQPPVVRGPRADPRRAAATATITSAGAPQNPPIPVGNPQQNVEIRMLLQKSDWYKNLNSKYKIMVNQQLALVSTELKRFHQDPSPNKVFDIQFILNNQNLQQILTNLGIYIDDNGQVAHIENDNDMMGGMGSDMDYGQGGGPNQMMMMNDPNMQQRMAMQQMEFLRAPPPNMNMMGQMGPGGPNGPGGPGGMYGGPSGMMPQFNRNSRNMGMMGMSPSGPSGGGGYNPFSGNGDNGGGGGGMMEPNYGGPNNPFANNFGGNSGGNFGGQQQAGRNRNNYRTGGMNHGGNRMNNPNRRVFKPNSRDRRGGGMGGGGGGRGDCNPNDEGMEESWDNDN